LLDYARGTIPYNANAKLPVPVRVVRVG